MTFKTYQWRIVIKVLLLLCSITAAAFAIAYHHFFYLWILIPVIAFQVFDFFRYHQHAQQEVEQFVESVEYRDFSRFFDVKHAPAELQSIRQGFNQINSAFKVISREKETQFLYLQKILALVDTGILSYEVEDGKIMWMNEAFKSLTSIPYLKTIHSLQKRLPELYIACIDLKPGDHKIETLQTERGAQKILLAATAFQTEGSTFKLIAFQNINMAIDETESNAWQKLLSVMTHEIMNSVAPISSLADTLKNRLHEAFEQPENARHSFEDLELGIETIKRRSEGLLKFAEVFRNLNKIKNLNLGKILVRDLFETLHLLLQPTLEQKGIELDIVLIDPAMEMELDTHLTEQVLINLLLNAIDAVKEKAEPRIVLSANVAPGKGTIEVADNGAGIPPDLIDQIFVPFFSTKKNGSGIGLSLCRQIMMLHKGSIHVQSREGEGTKFVLSF